MENGESEGELFGLYVARTEFVRYTKWNSTYEVTYICSLFALPFALCTKINTNLTCRIY